MPERLKFTVGYDGSAFAGWQSQLHRKTIQDELERAFHKISGARVRVHGAGRTDAGVHAFAQVAHVDLADRKISAARWPIALNAVLPDAVRVLDSRYVSEKFHARYSAKGKTYRYRIFEGPILPPFEFGRAWHIAAPLDVDLIKRAARIFVGRKDFAAFAANRGKKEESTVRTIRTIRVRKTRQLITIDVTGDGFLYKMVRLMVGAIVRVAQNKMAAEEIASRLQSARRDGPRFVGPAEGLYLVKVWY
jgi:tRNA pseudouridine38-40 synthase